MLDITSIGTVNVLQYWDLSCVQHRQSQPYIGVGVRSLKIEVFRFSIAAIDETVQTDQSYAIIGRFSGKVWRIFPDVGEGSS